MSALVCELERRHPNTRCRRSATGNRSSYKNNRPEAHSRESRMAFDKRKNVHQWEMSVVRKVVHRHRRRARSLMRDDVDDLCQECMVHWLEVRNRVRPQPGRPPAAFLARIVRNRLGDLIRQYETAKRAGDLDALSLDAPLATREGDATLHELIDDRSHCTGEIRRTRGLQDMRIDLQRAIARLAPHQIYLCGLLSEAGLSVPEVAMKLGIPRDVLYDELKRIRAVFAEVGLGDYLDE